MTTTPGKKIVDCCHRGCAHHPQLQVLEFAEREAARRLEAARQRHDAATAALDAAAAEHARVWNLEEQPEVKQLAWFARFTR